MDIWGWICSLSSSEEWQGSMELGSMKDEHSENTRTLLIKSERTAGSNTETLLTFSLCLQGFWPSPNPPSKTLWISDPVPMPVPNMKGKTILPLLHQLIQEIINRAAPLTSTTFSHTIKLKPTFLVVLDNIEESLLSSFFNLVFLCRLFWLCVCDAPTQVGSLYFQTMASQLDLIFLSCKPLLGFFLKSIGADLELHFMRSMGYILTKLLILRELDSNHHHHHREQQQQPTWCCAHSHATHTKGGFWLLKGYSPLLAMHREPNSHQNQYPTSNLPEDTKTAVLRYALAHQQLEAVAQLEFKVCLLEDHVRVDVRIDNLRLNVAKLAFSSASCGGEDNDDDGGGGGVGSEMGGEKHFPSRVCVWVGPGDEVDADVEGLSLERSSGNPEREVESRRIVKGSLGSTKFPKVKATSTSATRTRLRNWNMEQSAEGNTALFQMDLCDNASGIEVCSWRPATRGGGGGGGGDPRIGFRNRYSGGCRSFNKMGGVVFARDEYGQGVSWRLSKEVEEGSVLKWRLGTKVWLTYWPNQCTTSYFETRSVEWCEEVDLHVTQTT